ncbi:unnamed protein product [Phaedon cochleariae]|uniref:Uncharacterized protein n=1 Tax=Phaedon cochleariae TaxID=80249 RepID=A0A9N9SQA8_PHACE|nr:unnamed protein product [Phaedon cochleariae]
MSSMSQNQEGYESRIECDWNTFSFEKELSLRKESALEHLNNCRSLSEEICMDKSSEVQGKSRNQLEVLETGFRNSRQNYEKISSDFNTMKSDLKQIKDSNEMLNSKILSLRKVIEDLQEEESSASLDYKHDKDAYRKALNFYSKHTDLNVDLKERSNESVKGVMKFASVKQQSPIFVTVDKLQRKIIDFSCSELTTGYLNGESTICLANTPGLICSLREQFINTDKTSDRN